MRGECRWSVSPGSPAWQGPLVILDKMSCHLSEALAERPGSDSSSLLPGLMMERHGEEDAVGKKIYEDNITVLKW